MVGAVGCNQTKVYQGVCSQSVQVTVLKNVENLILKFESCDFDYLSFLPTLNSDRSLRRRRRSPSC